MTPYLITLVVHVEESQRSPDTWDWTEIVDSPAPVGVLGLSVLPEYPTEDQAFWLNTFVAQSHERVRNVFGDDQ